MYYHNLLCNCQQYIDGLNYRNGLNGLAHALGAIIRSITPDKRADAILHSMLAKQKRPHGGGLFVTYKAPNLMIGSHELLDVFVFRYFRQRRLELL